MTAMGIRVATRAYLQALIDERGWTVPAIDAYAERLANEYWWDDPDIRRKIGLAMIAYMDGWEAGYDEGFDAGVKDAERGAA